MAQAGLTTQSRPWLLAGLDLSVVPSLFVSKVAQTQSSSRVGVERHFVPLSAVLVWLPPVEPVDYAPERRSIYDENPGQVWVTVEDTNGNPESGLRVYAFDGGTYTGYNGTTNASGLVTFTLPIGDYRFRADKNGTQFWSGASNHCPVPGCTSAVVTVPASKEQVAGFAATPTFGEVPLCVQCVWPRAVEHDPADADHAAVRLVGCCYFPVLPFGHRAESSIIPSPMTASPSPTRRLRGQKRICTWWLPTGTTIPRNVASVR